MMIKNLFKKYWLFIFLSLIVGILISIYFINKDQEEELNLTVIPQQETDSYSIKTSLEFGELGKNIEGLEQKLDVYEILDPPFSNEEAINIAQFFNLTNQPQVYNDQRTNNIFYEWLTEEKFLTINLSNKNITFELLNAQIKNQINAPDLNIFKNQALDFLETNHLLPLDSINLVDIVLKKESYLEINEAFYQETDSIAQANGVIIQFQYQIKEKDLINSKVTFIFNLNQDLIKFNYQPFFKEINNLGLYPLKGESEILTIIKNHKDINYFNILGYYTTHDESENLIKINLKSIEIIYLKQNIKQSYLQPYFFVKGDGVMGDGRKAEVGLYIPAIQDQYLLK